MYFPWLGRHMVLGPGLRLTSKGVTGVPSSPMITRSTAWLVVTCVHKMKKRLDTSS